jgi:hypothetical protein
LAYFGIDESSGHEQTLLQLGERVYPLLSTPQFSHLEEHKPILPGMEPKTSSELTAEGASLGFDFGLLWAKYLIADCAPRLTWRMVHKPKNSIHYHWPVLDGFVVEFSPLSAGVAQATAVADRIRGADFLANVYRKQIQLLPENYVYTTPAWLKELEKKKRRPRAKEV